MKTAPRDFSVRENFRTAREASGRMLVGAFSKVFGLESLFLTGQELPITVAGGGGGGSADALDAYGSSWVAYACISRQMKDLSRVPFRVLRDPEDMESVTEPTSDPISALFSGRPYHSLSRAGFMKWVVMYLRLRGAFFVTFDNPNNPTEAIPWRDPRHWKARTTDEGRLGAWEYRKGTDHLVALGTDCIVGRDLRPGDPWGWQSPLAAASHALAIDKQGDTLNESTLAHGGERSEVYSTPKDMGKERQEQLGEKLKSRFTSPGKIPSPLILTNGLVPVESKLTVDDLKILDQQTWSAEKICSVFGMSPALLWKDSAPNRETYRTTVKRYWTDTLTGVAEEIERTFDLFTERWGVYVRFDFSDVEALQAELKEMVEIGAIMVRDMQIPVAEMNRRLGMGLEVENIPGAEDVLVPVHMIPASMLHDGYRDDYENAEGGKKAASGGSPDPSGSSPAGEGPSGVRVMTAGYIVPDEVRRAARQEIILRRHKDAAAVIARNAGRDSLERKTTKAWRKTLGGFKKKAVAIATKHGGDVDQLEKELRTLEAPMAEDIVGMLGPIHMDAAVDGVLSILDLVDEERYFSSPARADFAEVQERCRLFRAAPEIPEEALETIAGRARFFEKYGERLFDTIMGAIFDSISADDDVPTAIDVARIVRHNFNVSINRAAMIGRTEVGTAYNVGRFSTMREQGFEDHTWMTAKDELVRGNDAKDEFDHVHSDNTTRKVGKRFPCKLKYPQEDGGEAGNVINCRCLTIPVVK